VRTAKKSPERNCFHFLLDNNGVVSAVTSDSNHNFDIKPGAKWSEIWPGKTLEDNLYFTFERSTVPWQCRINSLLNAKKENIGYLATCHEIINDKTDHGLKQKIHFYETIINNSNDEIFITDGKGMIIFANPASEVNYGLNVTEMIGKSVWELEERGIYFPAITPIVLKEKRKITINQETATGKKLIVTATPVFDNKGAINIVICNTRDVTSLEDMKKSYHDMKNKVHKKERRGKFRNNTESNQLVYTESSPLAELMNILGKVAKTESTVLLQGETGTGKDLFARIIHDSSNRSDKDFLKVNCAALPQELIESELFGYRSGAFTGASSKGKIGQFSLADQGTIFLDEIAEIPIALQPKLLQVIEEQKFIPVGSKTVEEVNVRIIAATNRNLNEMMQKKQFRDDLFYRLCVFSINIPPLKDRIDDIPLLVDHYLKFFNQKHNCSLSISDQAMRCLVAYDWPGNVRELKHLVERLTVTMTSELIKPEHLPDHIISTFNAKEVPSATDHQQSLPSQIEKTEREIILQSYNRLKSSYKVARELGISQSSAVRKIRRYINS
jgi:PAS domain S-box-containing protein